MKFYMIVENEKNISLQQKVKQLSKALMTAGFVANPLMMMNFKIWGEIYKRFLPSYITFSETNKYTNATGADWSMGVLYAEHPRRNKELISLKEYKEFVLREMISDIANYIMDHISVSKMVIGTVSSLKIGANAKSSKQYDAEATIDCKLNSEYTFTCERTEPSGKQHEYIWIDRFPDVKAAVEHKSNKLEIIKSTDLEGDLGVNLTDLFKANVLGGKKVKFYINYRM